MGAGSITADIAACGVKMNPDRARQKAQEEFIAGREGRTQAAGEDLRRSDQGRPATTGGRPRGKRLRHVPPDEAHFLLVRAARKGHVQNRRSAVSGIVPDAGELLHQP